MAFMERQTYYGPYYLVSNDQGSTTLIPQDVTGTLPANVDPADVQDYCEGTVDTDNEGFAIVEHCTGWYGWYSAPGYMDCTDYSWADSEDALNEELNQMYGDDDEADDNDDEGR